MKIAILGNGAWATALAHVFSYHDHRIEMFCRDASSFDEEKHINRKYFPSIVLSEKIHFTLSLEECVTNADVVLFCIPSVAYREMAKKVNPFLKEHVLILSAAKGFDPLTLEPLGNVLKEELDQKKVTGVVSLIGPSFADEVILDKVTTICAVSKNLEAAKKAQVLFSTPTFRIYTNQDEISSQCAAALKNVIAIASGAIYGLGEGENAKAGLVTRGLKEMVRFGLSMGGNEQTFYGLTGIGDLLLTCSSMQSRNFSFGYALGKMDDAKKMMEENKKTVEGINTAKIAYEYALRHHLDMPIVSAVYKVCYQYEKPSVCLSMTMARELKSEM